MLLTMLSKYTGSFPAGVQALAEILEVREKILPVTIDKATIVAELTDGTRIALGSDSIHNSLPVGIILLASAIAAVVGYMAFKILLRLVKE